MIDLRVPVNLPKSGPSHAVSRDPRFPTWLYHAVHGTQLFKTEQAFNAAVAVGWVDSPAKLSAAPGEALPGPHAPVAPPVVPVEPVAPVPREFTTEELKSVHGVGASELIEAMESSTDAAFVQFVRDVETMNPKKVRPTVLQAADDRLKALAAAV